MIIKMTIYRLQEITEAKKPKWNLLNDCWLVCWHDRKFGNLRIKWKNIVLLQLKDGFIVEKKGKHRRYINVLTSTKRC